MNQKGYIGTVAVTGASGLIGRRLVPTLLAAGANVRVLARTPRVEQEDGVHVVQGDLRDEASLVALLQGADAVVHLAGMAHTALRTPSEVALATSVNVGGTQALLSAARSVGARHIMFSSSAHVYTGQRGLDLHEDDPKDSNAGYASMKLQAEDLLRQEAGAIPIISVLRPCLTYGSGVGFNLQQLMAAVRAGRYVHPGGADVLRSFASVDTVAAAAVHLLQSQQGGTYNVADRNPVSLREWIQTLAAELGAKPPRTIPVSVLRSLAFVCDGARRIGLAVPLTTEALDKLTAPFTLNTDRLAATGFVWPSTTVAVMQQMVAGSSQESRETPKT